MAASRMCARARWGGLALLVASVAGCPSDWKPRTGKAPGDLKSYQPFVALPKVTEFAGAGAELLEIRARFVKSDGTMDLEAKYSPTVFYKFLRPAGADPDLPVGAGGGANLRRTAILVKKPGRYEYTRKGGGTNVRVTASHDGMVEASNTPGRDKDRAEVVAAPKCSLADLWKAAIEAGAPADAVATITYDEKGYAFAIDDTDVRQHFNFACEPGSELTDRQQAKKERKEEKKRLKEEKKRLKEESSP